MVGAASHESADFAARVVLDPVGGIAGDMFVAALLDMRPAAEHVVHDAIACLDPPATLDVRAVKHSDGVLAGHRFVVSEPPQSTASQHDHTHWAALRVKLAQSRLPTATSDAAIAIFQRLAEAEAKVHGIAVDEVAFHEVGAWDSVIDIVSAAALISYLDEAFGHVAWQIRPLPIGSGLVETQHGMLPIPAPATTELLKGILVHDDGEAGERVTPTGAAIVRYLLDRSGAQPAASEAIVVRETGIGFGTRRLRHRSNILRATLFCRDDRLAAARPFKQQIAISERAVVLQFEIDDQSGEDLAIGLDFIRATDGVLDVCTWPVMGKKGRLATHVQVLGKHDATEDIANVIFDETTTLGLRVHETDRLILRRRQSRIEGHGMKLARRPSGLTAKIEADDLGSVPTHTAREQIRRSATKSLDQDEDADSD